MAINIDPARPSLMRMDYNGEGNYASTASLYCEFQETDQGLTLPPKIQSNDSFESEPAGTSFWGYEDLFPCTLSSADLDALLGFVQPELLGEEGRKEKSWVHTLKDHVGCQPSESVSKGSFTGNLLGKYTVPFVGEDEPIPAVEGGNASVSAPKALVTHNVEQGRQYTVESRCELQGVHVAGKNEAKPASQCKAQRPYSEQCSDYTPGEECSNSDASRSMPAVENPDGVQYSLLDGSREELIVPNNDWATRGCNEQSKTAKSLSIMNERGEDRPEYSPYGLDCPISFLEPGNIFSGSFERDGDCSKGGEPANQETLPIGSKRALPVSSGHEYQQLFQPARLQDSPQTNHHSKDDGVTTSWPALAPEQILLPLAFCLEDKNSGPSVAAIIGDLKRLLHSKLGGSALDSTFTAPAEIDEGLFPGFEKLLQTFQTNSKFKRSVITWLSRKMDNGEYLGTGPRRGGLDPKEIEWLESLGAHQYKDAIIDLLQFRKADNEHHIAEMSRLSAQLAYLQNDLQQAMARAGAFRDALLNIKTGSVVNNGPSQDLQTPYVIQTSTNCQIPQKAPHNYEEIAKSSSFDENSTSVSDAVGDGTWKCLRIENGVQCGQLNNVCLQGRDKGPSVVRKKCSKCKKMVADHEKEYYMTNPEPQSKKIKRKYDLYAYTASPAAGSFAYDPRKMARSNEFPDNQTPLDQGFKLHSATKFESLISLQSSLNLSGEISSCPDDQFTENRSLGVPQYEGLSEAFPEFSR